MPDREEGTSPIFALSMATATVCLAATVLNQGRNADRALSECRSSQGSQTVTETATVTATVTETETVSAVTGVNEYASIDPRGYTSMGSAQNEGNSQIGGVGSKAWETITVPTSTSTVGETKK
ncbi:hypothetical protein M231_01972 [Tremella mesenterica]|uniref:Uncharacterized protein n=1 Tax=Tremella mesenterica TaxID=5217 RepID=A0A4Q1BS16_TREME|nr:hypothetical protein M231_01972 [Tremella mesenterica]